jgi:Ca-activated chloride channel family protein
MKLRTAALLGIFGMVSSVGGAIAIPAWHPGATYIPAQKEPANPGQMEIAHFNAGQTLTVDARLGHASLSKGSKGETFLFAAVAGSDGQTQTASSASPLSLAIAIDRSGSMKGDRIANAMQAAVGIVERMRDGDTITVTAFDTDAMTVVSPTRVSSATRPAIEASIRSIRLGGDTCISCGLQSAMRLLESSGTTTDVERIILLSDGKTNNGITDLGGLRSMAGRMRDKNFSITTMGVDVEFDEKVMAALASESNGHHYFVESASDLPKIFSQEFDTLLASVASDAELEITLAPGVEAAEVFDRSFRREGNKIFVPFGTFSAKQEKTVLVKLNVPSDKEGTQAVAGIRLAYKDLGRKADGSCGGDLALKVVSDGSAQGDLDPFVAARLERSRTAKALLESNELFEQGKFEEARQLLQKQRDELSKTASLAKPAAKHMAGPRPTRGVDADFEGQIAAVDKAEANFAPMTNPAPVAGGGGGGGHGGFAVAPGATGTAAESRQGKAQVRTNTQSAVDLAF